MRSPLLSVFLGVFVLIASSAWSSDSRIVLQPQAGMMQVTARVPALGNQAFALGIPETLGCREAMLVNFPEAKIDWKGPDEEGVVTCTWGPGGRISYTLRLVPADDYVDVEMTIRNHTEFLWHDVFAFNCINPIQVRSFQDWKLEQVLQQSPVALVPLGTYEHHGWHLPIGLDGIKAHALCLRIAERTGGVVLPTFFYGTGGGHVGYKWTLIRPESEITPLIAATLDHVARQGFKVVVVLTGHYPHEQVDMVHRLAEQAQKRHPGVRFIGLSEPEVTTPAASDAFGGDHAAKYETSIKNRDCPPRPAFFSGPNA